MSVSCDGLRRPSESAFHIFLLMGSYWLLLTQTDARVVSFTTSSASRRPQRQAGDARGREQSANCQSASVRVRHTHTHRRAIPCARRAGHRAGSGLLHHMCREPRTGCLGGTLGRTGSGIRDRGGPEGPVPRLGRGGRNVSSPVWPHPLWQCGPGRCPCSCGGRGALHRGSPWSHLGPRLQTRSCLSLHTAREAVWSCVWGFWLPNQSYLMWVCGNPLFLHESVLVIRVSEELVHLRAHVCWGTRAHSLFL